METEAKEDRDDFSVGLMTWFVYVGIVMLCAWAARWALLHHHGVLFAACLVELVSCALVPACVTGEELTALRRLRRFNAKACPSCAAGYQLEAVPGDAVAACWYSNAGLQVAITCSGCGAIHLYSGRAELTGEW